MTTAPPLRKIDSTRQPHGRGAFRRFKDAAHRLGVIDAWYAYRDNVARKLMLDWARVHGIPVDESPGRSAS